MFLHYLRLPLTLGYVFDLELPHLLLFWQAAVMSGFRLLFLRFLIKLKQMPAFPVLSLTTIKNYTPLKLLSMRYPCVVVLQPYKTTQLSNPNIICKKENPKEKVKEKKSQIIDSFSL